MRNVLKVLSRLFFLGVLGYAIYEQMNRNESDRTWTGQVLFVPYDLRFPPTVDRVLARWWNPDDERILTPHVFGVGWSINLYQVVQQVQSLRG